MTEPIKTEVSRFVSEVRLANAIAAMNKCTNIENLVAIKDRYKTLVASRDIEKLKTAHLKNWRRIQSEAKSEKE